MVEIIQSAAEDWKASEWMNESRNTHSWITLSLTGSYVAMCNQSNPRE